jgi:hypothetical protein
MMLETEAIESPKNLRRSLQSVSYILEKEMKRIHYGMILIIVAITMCIAGMGIQQTYGDTI